MQMPNDNIHDNMETSESSNCTLSRLEHSNESEVKESYLKNNFMKLTEVLTEEIKNIL